MKCYVYKGEKKPDHYLYLPNELDVSESPEILPAGILSRLGELELVLKFELTADRKMPQADAKHVLESLSAQGFYLQIPKKDMAAEEDAIFG